MQATGSARLGPYVPQVVQRWVATEPHRRYLVLDATLVHVDISGFTALSERFARRGRLGAEQLTEAIDGCFEVLLVHAYANGGRLLAFGGDALLLLFEGRDHARKGTRGATAMRDRLQGLEPVPAPGGPVRLAMTVGVRSGPTHLLLVGGRHRQLVVAGPGASEVVVLEAAAAPGEVVVAPSTAARVPGIELGVRRDEGSVVLGGVGGADQHVPPAIQLDAAQLLPCIPEALRDHLRQGSDPEHRRIGVAFVGLHLPRAVVETDPDRAWEDLDATVGLVQDAAAQHGAVVLGADVDEDATKLVLVTGAPTSTDDDAARLLLTIRDVVAARPPLPVRVGATLGAVYAGDVGSRYRRTYTVMGDAVNLAARLHATAEPGTAIVTPELLRASRTAFQVQELPTVVVRGRAAPVTPLVLGPAHSGASAGTGTRDAGGRSSGHGVASPDDLPFVGRDIELATIADAIDSARTGRGQVLEVVGEAGIGKSRLVGEAIAALHDVRVVRTAGELYRAATPYAAVRSLVLDALGLPVELTGLDADTAQVAARLEGIVASELPTLEPWLPLLGQVLGLELADTDATGALAPRHRSTRLHSAVASLLTARWPTTTVVVVEDLQWADQASRDLLLALAGHVASTPWVLISTRRELDDPIVTSELVTVLPLGPLPTSAGVALAGDGEDQSPLSPAVLEDLAVRSGGNPLFLGELLAAARAGGGVGGLPDSVEATMTARIDRLAARDRRLLRQLAVLGTVVDASLAAAVLGITEQAVARELAGVEPFITLETGTIRFRHTLLRDVAYQGLPYRRRRELHGRATDVLESRGGAEVELLSIHAFLAGRMATAWRASVAAGRAAAEVWANADAARFLRRALEAGQQLRTVTPAERAAVGELLGDVQRHLGDTAAAVASYRAARRRCDDEVVAARLALKQARAQAGAQRFSQALALVTRALHRLEPVPGDDAAVQRAELLAWYAHLRQEQGRHDDALRVGRRAIEAAEAAGATGALAHALRILDWIHAQRGEMDLAVHSHRALALYEQLDDLPNQAGVRNNLGGFAYWAGRWDEASDHYRRAQLLDERTGDVLGAAFTRNNLAEILADQGRLDEATELLRTARRTFRASGYTAGVAYVRMNLGRVAAHAGRLDEAGDLLRRALEEHRAVGAGASAVETEARLAEVALLAGDDDAAAVAADALLRRTRADEGVAAVVPLLHRIRGALHLRAGRPSAALEALEASAAAARARDAAYEVALADAAAAEVAERLGDAERATTFRARSRRMLRTLGVQRVPWNAEGRLAR
jgi:class 3 adenylate cyclase/tetratricopeptide (TPR) repeat protein